MGDDEETLVARALYMQRITEAHKRYHDETAPARCVYDNEYFIALRELKEFFEAR